MFMSGSRDIRFYYIADKIFFAAQNIYGKM